MKKLSLQTIRNDKRTRKAVIGASVGAVLVLAAAVTVPVMLRNRTPAAQAAEPSVTVTEQTAAETAAAAPTSEAVTVPTASETTEPTTAAPPTTEKKENPKTSAKPAAQGSGNGSGAVAKQPAPNTPPAEPQKPNKKQWTQAEVDALVAEMKAYGISKGLTVNSAKGIQGSSWRNPASTQSTPEKAKQRLIYLIDEVYDFAIEDFGNCVGSTFNVVTQQYTDSDGYTQWEIYVVY